MLNLSDIRKKANKKGKKKTSPESPKLKMSDRPSTINGSQAGDAPVEEAAPVVAAGVQEGELASSEAPHAPLKTSDRETGNQTKGASLTHGEGRERDPLESLFNANPELDLATEETYFEGLVGQEHETEEDLCQLLSFSLGEEEYAVDIQDVQEIIKLREMTDIPRVPGFVLGIISLRGNIIPVFDLKQRLHLGTVEPALSTRIVVCRDGRKSVGLVVDRINQVVRLPEQAIEQVSGLLSGINKDLVSGVGRYQGRMLILLDLPSVLAVEQN